MNPFRAAQTRASVHPPVRRWRSMLAAAAIAVLALAGVTALATAPAAAEEVTVDIVVPDLELTATPGDCSTGDDGTLTLLFAGLLEGEVYEYSVDSDAVSLFESFVAGGPSEEVVVTELPPANYLVYVEWAAEVPSDPVFEWTGVAIEPCQPGLTVEVTECPAHGADGAALLTVSNLVDGVDYDVKVTGRGDADGTPYGGVHAVTGDTSGTAQLLVSPLSAGADYTAWIDGVWTTPPWEEPPFVGGGNFVPLESVALAASLDFSLKPCPAVSTPPVLAATGTDDSGRLLLASMLLFGLGGAALLATRQRAVAVRDRG